MGLPAIQSDIVISEATFERIVLDGDLSALTPAQRLEYYTARCEAVGLDTLSQPFQYLRLSGKLTLYATKTATDQLRALHGISVVSLEAREFGDVYVVIANVRDAEGRTDSATGAVPTVGLKAEALANALMKAETKAKRRATISICGLGMLDESELDTIPPSQAIREPIMHAAEPALPPPARGPRNANAAAPKTFAAMLSGALDYWQRIKPSHRIDEPARRRDTLIHGLKDWAVDAELMPEDRADDSLEDALERVYIAHTQDMRKEMIHIIDGRTKPAAAAGTPDAAVPVASCSG